VICLYIIDKSGCSSHEGVLITGDNEEVNTLSELPVVERLDYIAVRACGEVRDIPFGRIRGLRPASVPHKLCLSLHGHPEHPARVWCHVNRFKGKEMNKRHDALSKKAEALTDEDADLLVVGDGPSFEVSQVLTLFSTPRDP